MVCIWVLLAKQPPPPSDTMQNSGENCSSSSSMHSVLVRWGLTSSYGFAKGIDLFWRDNKSIKSTDYWVSYSYLDSERDYRNYPTKAQPNFANTHNLSVVGKYFIEACNFQYDIVSIQQYAINVFPATISFIQALINSRACLKMLAQQKSAFCFS